MNPFNITQAEMNIEKIDFLKNLILLIWKGADAQVSELEFRIVEQMVTDYYDAYFHKFDGYDPVQRETLRKTLTAYEKRRNSENTEDLSLLEKKVEERIAQLEKRRKALKVTSLSFNTFYEYSCERLELICLENNISGIDYDRYIYMIQPFYKGGTYDKILNENVDTTLFSETFIVFEVDAIKENKKQPGYIPCGSAITSYARNFTIRAAQKNFYGADKPGFAYADTDSLHCDDMSPEDLVDIPVHESKFCHWKLESFWDRAIFTRQKTYIEHVTHENQRKIDTPYYDVKGAGIPERSKKIFIDKIEKGEYDLTDFKVGLKLEGKLVAKRIKGGTVLKETTYEMR